MSREMWRKHYARRLAEAEEQFPHITDFREPWAADMADQDCADEMASKADEMVDAAKDRGL